MDKSNLLKTAFIIGILLLVVGDVAAAITATNPATILASIICKVGQILIYIIFGVAAIVILMSTVKWVGSADDPAARGAARLTIIHVLIGLLITIVSIYLLGYLFSGYLTVTGILDPITMISGTCP